MRKTNLHLVQRNEKTGVSVWTCAGCGEEMVEIPGGSLKPHTPLQCIAADLLRIAGTLERLEERG